MPRGDELWIFYEKATSDIYYRVFDHGLISEPFPLITEGFPYLQDAVVVGTKVMVFLQIQEEGKDQKTLVYRIYDGEWSSLEALASAEEGFLSGGAPVQMADGTVFIFWNGAQSLETQPWKVDLYYRWYNGDWSGIYKLTDTPDIWEATFSGTEYEDQLVIIWRDKESTMVYASYASRGEGEAAEPGELEQVTPKIEPEKPETHSMWYYKIKEYLYLVPIGGVVCALLVLWYVKKRMSPEEESKKVEIGKRRKKKAQRKSR